ncbi:MAG: hypothetical protein JO205_11515 [Pseudolabrys sp.]|nr:hypothetical protein [Pseudolabrys sp.]
MSTGTGFLIGVGSVAVALSVGFAGGYVLTAPDEAAKIKPAAYSAPAKNEKNEPLQAKTET